MSSEAKIPVAVLGATGTVGQRFISLLDGHPWFRVAEVTGSERSIGLPYGEAVQWALPGSPPPEVAAMVVQETTPSLRSPLVFSALGTDVAGPAEAALREAGFFVVSNASSHRMDTDVPLIVPEVNPDHLEALRERPGRGAIVTNPNCSTIGMVLALAPLERELGIEKVSVVTLQAVSGAGLPGVPSMMMVDNVVPFISSEEEKLESEAAKILGRRVARSFEPAAITVSAQCNRVNVLDGHTECLSLGLRRKASPERVAEVLRAFDPPETRSLPSSPRPLLLVASERDRPQPRLDRDRGAGMSVTVGRIRACPILDVRMVVLSHNTVRGAAGGALLVAELAVERGLVAGASRPL